MMIYHAWLMLRSYTDKPYHQFFTHDCCVIGRASTHPIHIIPRQNQQNCILQLLVDFSPGFCPLNCTLYNTSTSPTALPTYLILISGAISGHGGSVPLGWMVTMTQYERKVQKRVPLLPHQTKSPPLPHDSYCMYGLHNEINCRLQ